MIEKIVKRKENEMMISQGMAILSLKIIHPLTKNSKRCISQNNSNIHNKWMKMMMNKWISENEWVWMYDEKVHQKNPSVME